MIRTLLAATFVLSAAPASALTLDFSEFVHGDIVSTTQGVTITTTNRSTGPNLGVAFDTNASGTADRDLERGGAWDRGNLAPQTDLGRALIVQENLAGCDAVSCSRPDDEGSRPAGYFDFDFTGVGEFTSLQMDLIDVESTTMEAGFVEFFSGATSLGSVDFMDFLDDAGVVFGDNSANRIEPIVVASLGGGSSFDHMRIALGDSGAIDNIKLSPAIPEPSAALVFGLGLALVGRRSARRSA